MKKFFKYSFIIILSLLFITIISSYIVIKSINPNKYKPFIESTLTKAINRKVKINGELSWFIYPNLGIKINNLSIPNPSELNDDDNSMLELNHGEVSLGLIALLQKNIVIKTFNLDNLTLHLIKKNGKNNWSFNDNNKSKGTNNSDIKPALQFGIDNFQFHNLSVSYDDYDKNQHYQIQDAKLELSSDFNGGIKIDTKNEFIDIKNINLNYNDNLISHINCQINNFTDYQYNGQIDITKLQLNQINRVLQLKLFAKPLLDNIQINSKFVGDKNNIHLNNTLINMSDYLKIKFNNTVITNFKQPQITSNIYIMPFSLHKIVSLVGFNEKIINDIDWLNNVEFSSQIKANNQSIYLDNLNLKITDTNIMGNIAITSFKPINIKENLLIDNLDLSHVIDLNGFKVINKNTRVVSNLSIKDSIKSLTDQTKINIDNITIKGLSIDELIDEFNQEVLNKFNQDLGQIINSTPTIINNISKYKQKIQKLIAKDNNRDYLKSSNLGRLIINANSINGIVNNSNFNLDGPSIISNGNGKINLINKTLDYNINSKIHKKNINKIMQQLVITSKIDGKLNDPQINLDWVSLQNQIIKMSLNNSNQAVQKIINNNLNNNSKNTINDINKSVTKAIDNFFGR